MVKKKNSDDSLIYSIIEAIEEIKGNDINEDKEKIIDQVMNSDGNESVSVKANEDKNKNGQGELDKCRE